MPVQTFRDNDVGYETWLAANPAGWVVNARRSPSAAYLKLHRAECTTISELQVGYRRWTTGEYIKICAERRDELDAWAQQAFGAEVQDGCHCVRHGSRSRLRPRGAAFTPLAAPVVVDAEGYRTVKTAAVI